MSSITINFPGGVRVEIHEMGKQDDLNVIAYDHSGREVDIDWSFAELGVVEPEDLPEYLGKARDHRL